MSGADELVRDQVKANHRHRNDAINMADALCARIASHRLGAPLPDVFDDIRAMREERDDERLGDLV